MKTPLIHNANSLINKAFSLAQESVPGAWMTNDWDIQSESLSNYPPANIWYEDELVTIELGVSGFSKEELDVKYDGRTLSIIGTKPPRDTDKRVYVKRGLASRSFNKQFITRIPHEIGKATLKDGLFTIQLRKVEPPSYPITIIED